MGLTRGVKIQFLSLYLKVVLPERIRAHLSASDFPKCRSQHQTLEGGYFHICGCDASNDVLTHIHNGFEMILVGDPRKNEEEKRTNATLPLSCQS